MKENTIILNEKDNVATALADLNKGDSLSINFGDKAFAICLKNPIPFGHKFSLVDIEKGLPIIKYGEVIGEATTHISAGEHVHIHNVVSTRGRGDLAEGATK